MSGRWRLLYSLRFSCVSCGRHLAVLPAMLAIRRLIGRAAQFAFAAVWSQAAAVAAPIYLLRDHRLSARQRRQ